MFSKEFMQYLHSKDTKEKKQNANNEQNSVTKPLLYIILKYNTAPKRA